MLWQSVFLHLAICGRHRKAGRQTGREGRGAGDEKTASSELHCSSAASPLQLAPRLIRMGENAHWRRRASMKPTPFSAVHAPVAWNAALCFFPHALQNSAVCIIRCGMLGNGLLSSLWGILGHLLCRPVKVFFFFLDSELSWALFPEAVSLTQCNTLNW